MKSQLSMEQTEQSSWGGLQATEKRILALSSAHIVYTNRCKQEALLKWSSHFKIYRERAVMASAEISSCGMWMDDNNNNTTNNKFYIYIALFKVLKDTLHSFKRS